jgi:hypothetical protein
MHAWWPKSKLWRLTKKAPINLHYNTKAAISLAGASAYFLEKKDGLFGFRIFFDRLNVALCPPKLTTM